MTPFDINCRHILNGLLDSRDPRIFEDQLLSLVRQADEFIGIVYVWKTSSPIPRFNGSDEIVYIGKTKHTLSQRYTKSNVYADTKTFWLRYLYIINHFGPIQIEIYKADDPDQMENDFLFEYHLKNFESPPLNNMNFKLSRLSKQQLHRFYKTVGDPNAISQTKQPETASNDL